ncbi:hypothetical protein ACH40E_33300 [Streptomyces acidicola]|uniref:hypothetical protein n=1 Tax=Streptomyces acidicola TaxID=2596892 RepID=UPI003790E991
MGTESTLTSTTDYAPTRWERIPLADQRRALAALDRITELHPTLPAAYITLSYVTPDLVTVQVQSWGALEAWRVALNVPSADVRPGNCAPEREHIEFEGTVDDARVRVYVMGDVVKTVAAEDSAVAA